VGSNPSLTTAAAGIGVFRSRRLLSESRIVEGKSGVTDGLGGLGLKIA
jgi:hypothetical protein